jgi:hypothetical protein
MRLLICLMLCSCPLSAMAMYKCEIGQAGSTERKVTYSDTPCQAGKSTTIEPSQNALSIVHESNDTQLQKQKEELHRLERERHRREVQEDKAAQKSAKAYAARQKQCSKLALQQKWHEEDASMATGKTADRAKLRARRSAESYHAECV